MYDRAFELRESGRSDSAFAYFDKAKDLFLKKKDSLGAGKCLVNMAIIATDHGDYFGGQELSITALAFLKKDLKQHHPYITSNFNNLGIACFNLKSYDKAIAFYQQSLTGNNNSSERLVIENNIANVYSMKGEFGKAVAIYQRVLAQTIRQKSDYARALTNFSSMKWKRDHRYNAAPELLKAMEIRLKENDAHGLNSSYSHLANYYKNLKPDSALFYARKHYQVAKLVANGNDELYALEQLITLVPETETKKYFNAYNRLNDSISTARSAAANQFALIRYETEKGIADNLVLQRDNAESRLQIVKQKVITGISFLLLILGITGAWFLLKRRKQQMDTASQNAINNNQLQTSKRVHDVVANGLYQVMTEIDNKDSFDKEMLLDKIEDLYEKSRDISYERPEPSVFDFQHALADLLKSFATKTTRVVLAGNSKELWLEIPEAIRSQIKVVLQELMVNMRKHSMAGNVVLQFERLEERIHIYYQDNGVGMSDDIIFNNGLTNTGNRIAAIGGEITFETQAEQGLKIHIHFPIAKSNI
jgi:tetratricopeptide (TPR) repeat protein